MHALRPKRVWNCRSMGILIKVTVIPDQMICGGGNISHSCLHSYDFLCQFVLKYMQCESNQVRVSGSLVDKEYSVLVVEVF